MTTRALLLAFAREFLPGAHPIVGRERDDQLAELLTNWADESLDVAARAPLVDALPTLDATAIEPSKWQPAANSSEMESKVNQTIAGSVATIPRYSGPRGRTPEVRSCYRIHFALASPRSSRRQCSR